MPTLKAWPAQLPSSHKKSSTGQLWHCAVVNSNQFSQTHDWHFDNGPFWEAHNEQWNEITSDARCNRFLNADFVPTPALPFNGSNFSCSKSHTVMLWWKSERLDSQVSDSRKLLQVPARFATRRQPGPLYSAVRKPACATSMVKPNPQQQLFTNIYYSGARFNVQSKQDTDSVATAVGGPWIASNMLHINELFLEFQNPKLWIFTL